MTEEERKILIGILEKRLKPFTIKVPPIGIPTDVKDYDKFGTQHLNSLILLKILKGS